MFITLTDINGCVAYYEHTAIIGIKARNAAMNGSGEIHGGSELLLVSGFRDWVAEAPKDVVGRIADEKKSVEVRADYWAAQRKWVGNE